MRHLRTLSQLEISAARPGDAAGLDDGERVLRLDRRDLGRVGLAAVIGDAGIQRGIGDREIVDGTAARP